MTKFIIKIKCLKNLLKKTKSLLKRNKKVWYTTDLQKTLMRTHRQGFKNDASNFAESELLL